MKKTRTMKKVASIATAALMTACLAVPMAVSAATAETGGLTISFNTQDETDKGIHKFEAYQIFSGTMSGGVLTEINWGDAVSGVSDSILTALKASTTLGDLFKNCETAEDVAKVLGGTKTETIEGVEQTSAVFEDDAALAQEVAKIIGNAINANAGAVTSGQFNAATDTTPASISKLPAGYYLIQDVDGSPSYEDGADNSGAKTRYILKLTAENAQVEIKSAAPTVDKQVLDEVADAEEGHEEGWGETADHAINETFQFKLIATIPANSDLAAYNAYKLIFSDVMSEGVSFESVESVAVAGYTGDVAYTLSDNVNSLDDGKTFDGDGSTAWTLTIADLLDYDNNLTDGATVEIIYNAHLNTDAYVNDASGDTTNANTVKLNYSNNPYWDGTVGSDSDETGETKEDTVWVFTYQINNTKVDASNNNAPLAGVKFGLYDSTGNNRIALAYDNELKAYRLAVDDEPGVDMESTLNADESAAVFNIVGLDVGTYVLKEIQPLAGYNRCPDTTITITAKHIEDADEAGATVDLTGSQNMSNEIQNKKGTTLPGTGGIGTTLFYLIGGTMFAGSGVYLISKKRMKNKEEQ
ncbi:MAG: isopeptide-forming domain-containing fimbrial protein [Oscillospiraceae bacterium]|nr:isopeptide-forming domain-containing fimbrial protein [Oscillospiraceae bacterium]